MEFVLKLFVSVH